MSRKNPGKVIQLSILQTKYSNKPALFLIIDFLISLPLQLHDQTRWKRNGTLNTQSVRVLTALIAVFLRVSGVQDNYRSFDFIVKMFVFDSGFSLIIHSESRLSLIVGPLLLKHAASAYCFTLWVSAFSKLINWFHQWCCPASPVTGNRLLAPNWHFPSKELITIACRGDNSRLTCE